MVEKFSLVNSIGFGGNVPNGLLVHPSNKFVVHALGTTVVIKKLGKDNKINNSEQEFLTGHDKEITCLALSKSGRYLASGQESPRGFKADIIVWDVESRQIVHRFSLHKVEVAKLAFSPNDKFLASLGGEDDNSVVVWDLEDGKAVCGSPASRESEGATTQLSFYNNDDYHFVTAGKYTLRVWEIDMRIRKIRPTEVQLGKLKRIMQSICVLPDDSGVYCGTSSGDVILFSLNNFLLKTTGPVKKKYSQGVTAIGLTDNGSLVIGTGDGLISILDKETYTKELYITLQGGITSLAFGAGSIFAGTALSNLYVVDQKSFVAKLNATCQFKSVSSIVFPRDYSKLFATSSGSDIRVWNSETADELLRIEVPNVVCNCVTFTPSGNSIVSGWSDGKIRAFTPQTGKLMFTIHDAHQQGVTAVACTSDGTRLVSGGADSQLRIWKLGKQSQTMEAALKEHKGVINSIDIRKDDTECVTASNDGSVVTWDLVRFARSQCMFQGTMFKQAVYHPDESQIVSVGTDKRITWWDAFDGTSLREIEASLTGELATVALTSDGQYLLTGGGDKLLKLYDFEEGVELFHDDGHSSPITAVAVSPDNAFVVSGSAEGALFIWRLE